MADPVVQAHARAALARKEADDWRAEADRLREGIRQHRDTVLTVVGSGWSDADERLWSLLNDDRDTV